MNELEIKEVDLIIKRLPVLPVAAQKIIELCSDGATDSRKIAEVLSTDSALTAMALRVANSAFYGIPRVVFNAVDAVSILGMSTISTIASVALVKQVTSLELKHDAFNLNLFFEHCLKAACIARLIAHGYNVGPNKGFTIGLLHDIGGLVLAASGKEAYINDMVSGIPCHFDHAPAGAYLAKVWKFPADIEQAIETHHSAKASNLALLADDSCKLSMSMGLATHGVITISNSFFSTDEIELLLTKAEDHYQVFKGLLAHE